MLKSTFNYILLIVATFILLASHAIAQSKQDITEAKKVISGIYLINVYDHNCETLKPSIDKSHAEKILSSSSYDDYPANANEIYELRAKDKIYWDTLFRSYYTDNIADEYANFCQKVFIPKSVAEKVFSDYRYPHNFDELGSFTIKNLQFSKFIKKNKNLITDVTVRLLNNEKFTLTYILHKEARGWRIFDIIEYGKAEIGRDQYINRSLQEGIQTRGARKN
jgi:hypothetical protein